MKIIKIFLASSEELEDDRNALGNLVRQLNTTYEKRGVHLELFEWEDYDAAYNDRRKQDEYNDKVRASDMFLAIFHRVGGQFTIEEFNVATEEFRRKGSPKAYVYCKDLKDGEVESAELAAFKKRLFHEMGHYWSRYDNRDTFKLHFVMQLQLVESSHGTELKVEEGNVVLDGQTIARLDRLPFASLNADFQQMSTRLTELQAKIEKARLMVEKYPDEKEFKEDLQSLLNEYNKLKEEFAKYQNNLFATAKRIAQLQGERITERMRRAIEAFNEGRVRDANIILNEAEHDGEMALQEYKRSKEIAEQKRQNVINSIEELLLKASTTMADLSTSADERIAKTDLLYTQADTMAQEIDYEPERYDKLLFDYANFTGVYGFYNKTITILSRVVEIRERIFGAEHIETATVYSNIGTIYNCMGKHAKALEFLLKALAIDQKSCGTEENLYLATSYVNIGNCYFGLGDVDNAMISHFKALDICKKCLGEEHPDTASAYYCIGSGYEMLGSYDKALEYFIKTLNIRQRCLGEEHPAIVASYNSIGSAYERLGNPDKALYYLSKALALCEKVLGNQHHIFPILCLNISKIYCDLQDFDKALELALKALAIIDKGSDKKRSEIVNLYLLIGFINEKLSDYEKSLEYNIKALNLQKKVLGTEGVVLAKQYFGIARIYIQHLSNYEKALEYGLKGLDINERLLGSQHLDTASFYNIVGTCYTHLGNYEKALEYCIKDVRTREKILGTTHIHIADAYVNLGVVYSNLGRHRKALKYLLRAYRRVGLDQRKVDGAILRSNIGIVYVNLGRYNKAIKYLTQACAILQIELGSRHQTTVHYQSVLTDIYLARSVVSRLRWSRAWKILLVIVFLLVLLWAIHTNNGLYI